MGLENSPAVFVLAGIAVYLVGYCFYSKWADRKIWETDANRSTPEHVNLDGVEYFPVGRYVLYGFQFKSVAALGPIVGPIIAVAVWGWVPALLWLVFGNFFIGWVQDYSALMLSVRNEGKSFGPLAYELLGDKPRGILLGYLLFYFLLISAAFIYVLATVLNGTPGSGVSLFGLIATSVIAGQLIYRFRTNIVTVTVTSICLIVLSIADGVLLPFPARNFLGPGVPTLTFWVILIGIVLFVGSVLPLPSFIAPMNYVAFFPTLVAVVLVVVGTLASPVTGISFGQAAFKGFMGDVGKFYESAGPIWPLLFVTIACGSISGWHSLISSGISSRQLDVETDARPVGAGAMITEGLVGLSAFAAVAILASPTSGAGDYVKGAVALTVPFFSEAAKTTLGIFFSLFLLLMGFTVQTLITRYWRVVSAELVSGREGITRLLGQKHVATIVGLVLPSFFTLTGSWINMWVFFGGTNQLLAGFALGIIAVYLAKMKKTVWYVKWPAIFMIPTTLAALLWETWVFLRAVVTNKPLAAQATLVALGGDAAAAAANVGSFIVGVTTFILGSAMAYYLLTSYTRWREDTSVTGVVGGPDVSAVSIHADDLDEPKTDSLVS
jgi:carbon starvation protein